MSKNLQTQIKPECEFSASLPSYSSVLFLAGFLLIGVHTDFDHRLTFCQPKHTIHLSCPECDGLHVKS